MTPHLDPIVIDVFCGVGGLSLGAARAGFTVRGAIDNDAHAMAAHRRNFPATIHLSSDVAMIDGNAMRDQFEIGANELLGVIGGPPCQGFSNIGRRDHMDKRNELFVDFFRIVSELEPAFFVAENVPGIMRSGNDAIREKAYSYVERRYVVLDPIPVAAHDYGAPTTRTRMFFIGYRPDMVDGLEREQFLPTRPVETVRVKNALAGLPFKVDPRWQNESEGWRIVRCTGEGHYHSRLHGHIPPGVGDPVALHRLKTENRASGTIGTLHSEPVTARYKVLKAGETDRISKAQRLDPNGFCPTIRAGTGPDFGSYQAVRPIHPSSPRVITPREASRLQGFPDWFTFSHTKWHSFRQIGNSVSPIVAERLLNVIRSSFPTGPTE